MTVADIAMIKESAVVIIAVGDPAPVEEPNLREELGKNMPNLEKELGKEETNSQKELRKEETNSQKESGKEEPNSQKELEKKEPNSQKKLRKNLPNLQELGKNVQVFKKIIPGVAKWCPKAVIVVVTQPIEVMSYIAWKLSKFPSNRVLGTGTLIDSVRFQYYLSQKLGLSNNSISCMNIGAQGGPNSGM